MKTTIKFIDSDLTTGKTTLMVGSKLIDITREAYQMLHSLAKDWRNNLEVVSQPNKRTVMKFNSKRLSVGQVGRAQTRLICTILAGYKVQHLVGYKDYTNA